MLLIPQFASLAAGPQGQTVPSFWLLAGLIVVATFGATFIASIMLRRFLRSTRQATRESILDAAPRTENSSAFMTASMQAVIQKLRDQEKELERLHRAERERAEQTERMSEEVTRNMPAGLVVVGANGIIASANPAAEQTLGIRGLPYRRFREVLGEDSDLSRLIADCLASGRIFRREEVRHSTPAGEAHLLGVTISPLRREGKISGVICLLTDLTELAALQQQVQLKENLAALGELSAGIAHEFKNALATISGYAQMLKAEPSAADAAEHAGKILEQTQNITRVVTEFLKYARPLPISTEPVALQPVIERVVAEIAEAMPAARIRHEGAFATVAGDEALLRQVFLNLARNAAEASSDAANGARVLLRGEVLNGEETGLQRITVFDNGKGIPPDAQPKLFRPFFTTKASGTGLGLAVVQKIVVQHGGQVEARNRPEGGAAFIVTLPAIRPLAEAVQ
jgi:PAS domain S-box-containing protein